MREADMAGTKFTKTVSVPLKDGQSAHYVAGRSYDNVPEVHLEHARTHGALPPLKAGPKS
jgi:hypothetical protein